MRSHELAEPDFDALARGTAGCAVVARLSRAERSYRRMVLRATLDALRGVPAARGPLEPLDRAWDLLIEAQRQAPDETAAVLDCPQVGSWAAYLLRRLRYGAQDSTPLWVDVGHLHAIVSAVVIRAGIDASLAVPVRQGVVHLPTLGHAILEVRESWEIAQIKVGAEVNGGRKVSRIVGRSEIIVAGRVRADDVADTDHTSWRPLPSLEFVSRGEVLSLNLEDADPYRLIGEIAAPAALDSSVRKGWSKVLGETWEMLVSGHRDLADELAAVTTTLVPLQKTAPFRPHSASTGDAFGSAVVSKPDDAAQLAATLVHELGHFKLGALMHLVDLHEPTGSHFGYTPWRDDPRPTRGILHGIFAFFQVVGFWRRQRVLANADEAMFAHFEFAFWRSQTVATARRLYGSPEITDLGRRLLDGVLGSLAPWISEPVPAEAASLARLTTRDHQALWRAHHLRPPAATVADLASAWTDGRPAPADAVSMAASGELTPDPAVRGLDGRACLARLWLSDRDRFRRSAASGADRVVAGTTEADHALIEGDLVTARRLYLADLNTSPDWTWAWVGLGLTGGEYRALADRPDLVLAVSAAVDAATGQRPPPSELAAWLLPALSTSSIDPGLDADDGVGRAPRSSEPGGGWPAPA